MREEEARELLGVEPGVAPKVLRRAYLRAVKKHKPERDPEGFQRVREAFDLLSLTASFAPLPASAEDMTLQSSPMPPEDGADQGPPERERAVPREPDDEPSDAPTRSASVEDAPLDTDRNQGALTASEVAESVHDRADALDRELAGATAEQRIARLFEMIAKEPDEQEWRFWLVEECLAADDMHNLERAVHEGLPDGHTIGLYDLAHMAPDRLSEEDIEHLAKEDPAFATRLLLQRGDTDAAAARLADNADILSARDHVNVDQHVELALDLMEQDDIEAARRHVDEVHHALEVTGSSLRMAEHTRLRWALLQDLVAVWDELPLEAEAAFIKIVREPYGELGPMELGDFRNSFPGHARKLARTVQKEAPTLGPLVVETLRSHPVQQRTRGGSKGYAWGLPMVAFALFALLRLLTSSSCRPDRHADINADINARVSAVAEMQLAAERFERVQRSAAQIRTNALCARNWPGCEAALAALRAIEVGRCEEARAAIDTLSANPATDGDTRPTELVQIFEGLHHHRCNP